MELYQGRPKDDSGRLEREIRTYDFLDSLGIVYQRTDHEPVETMEACHDIDRTLGVPMCKNLFLCDRYKTRFFLLLMPGEKRFRTKELTRKIDIPRLSFADAEHMLQYLDIEPGAVSVMGLMNDREKAVELLVDEDVLREEYIGCHPCVCTSSLKMSTEDVFKRFLPATGHGYRIVHLEGED